MHTEGMIRALPATWGWPALTWRQYALAALVAVNTILLVIVLAAFLMADVGTDWMVYREAGVRVASRTVYDAQSYYVFRYSPVLAYLFAAIAPLGYLPWAAAHFAALLALPRRVALIALVSFPFWTDVYNGNTMTFVFVAAFLALRGSRWGIIAFVVLAVLMPRPLMLPLLAWMFWQRPTWRLPMVVIAVGVLVASLATGMGVMWLSSLLHTGQEFGSMVDIGPGGYIGLLWIPIGAVLAVILTWRGRIGLASLAASPYWLSYYLLMGLLELNRPASASRDELPIRGE